jgi:RND family efflux transporter MFP subunit
MKKLVIGVLVLVVIVGFLIAANFGGSKKSLAASPGTQNDSNEGISAVPVHLPRYASLKRTTTQPMTMRANYEAKIYAKVAGYLKELRVDIGQRVKKDEILGVISVPEIDVSIETQAKTIERLRADEERAQAGLVLAEAGLAASRAAIGRADADIANETAQVGALRAEFDRVKQLVANNTLAPQLIDETRQRYEGSQSAKAAAEASLNMAKAQVNVSEAKIKSAQSELHVAQAETAIARKKLDELRTMQAFAELRSPFDGIVTQRHVDPGDLVRSVLSASEPPRQALFTVAQVATLRACVTVPEKDAPWLAPGKTATLKLQSLPGRIFEGRVSRISGALDESTRTMMVEIDMPNAGNEVLPGMYGEATIVLEEKRDAVLLSAKSVRHDEQGRSFVYVVKDGDVVQKTEVKIGLDDGNDLEILAPLNGRERIVDATLASLKDGQHVIVQ